MLDTNLTGQLKAYLERVREPFEMVASLDDSSSAHEMRELLEEVAALSPLILSLIHISEPTRPY